MPLPTNTCGNIYPFILSQITLTFANSYNESVKGKARTYAFKEKRNAIAIEKASHNVSLKQLKESWSKCVEICDNKNLAWLAKKIPKQCLVQMIIKVPSQVKEMIANQEELFSGKPLVQRRMTRFVNLCAAFTLQQNRQFDVDFEERMRFRKMMAEIADDSEGEDY